MSEFRLPIDEPSNLEEISGNLEALVEHYNSVLADLDEDVFYKVIPMSGDEGVIAVGTFTPSHKVKVKINNVEYYLQLDAV